MANASGKKAAKSVPGEVENVRVVIRLRPMSEKEEKEGAKNIAVVDKEEKIITLYKSDEKTKTFKFDYIFTEECTQMDLYKHIAYPIVEKSLHGYNGTIFAYGQTGTGKTYTMSGLPKHPDLKGIIPNAFAHIFSQISRASGKKSFVVTVTYLEIYNEDVRDLLAANASAKLEVRERTDVGVYVKDLMGFTVNSIESITELMNRGNVNRMTRSTLMNDVSSRSHAIFTITIESKDQMDNKTTIGKLNLVDLAGSERLSRTHATGERLKEASNINQSLSVLGNVISALVDGKSTHIPYRNSKLTRLLQDSLGGNSKTAMIAMVSPASTDYEESICTLRYASRVKYIRNTARVNVETKKGLIECFELEIEKLQQRIQSISVYEAKMAESQSRKKERAVVHEEECRKQTEEINKTEKEKHELINKISTIQKKILVGGENLFEKAASQTYMLEVSEEEIVNMEKHRIQLEEEIRQKELERVEVEEQYASLQEEEVGLSKRIKKVQTLLNEVREEYADKEHEYQRETEALLDNYRLLVRELQLTHMMIENYVPKEYLKLIELHMIWNVETAEFQMRGVAYTGNNMRKSTTHSAHSDAQKAGIGGLGNGRRGMRPVYHSYNGGGGGGGGGAGNGGSGGGGGGGGGGGRKSTSERRVRTSSVPRPSGVRKSAAKHHGERN